MDDLTLYLEATKFIDCEHKSVQRLSAELAAGLSNDRDKAVKLFYFVRDEIRYNMYSFSSDVETFRSSYVLKKGEGWCVQKAVLLAALCRAAGIPCGLVIASIRNHKSPPEAVKMMGTNVFFPHAFNRIYLNGRWIKATAAFDREVCERMAAPAVEFDGVNDAILPDKDLNGSPYIEYVEEYGYFSDLPWQMILEKSKAVYGKQWEVMFAST